MLAGNAALFDADPDEQKKERAEGYALYEEKPNLRRKGKSTAEDADAEKSPRPLPIADDVDAAAAGHRHDARRHMVPSCVRSLFSATPQAEQ